MASAVAQIVLSGALGSRTWSVTAQSQDTAAGGSLLLTLATSTTGATPPTQETNYQLIFYIDNTQTAVKVLAPGNGFNGTQTLYFTVDGTVAAAARAGTLRMRIIVDQTAGVGTTQYHGDSDGTNTPPTGYTFTTLSSGFVRGTTTATTTLNAATYAYSDTITATTVLGAVPYQSQTLNVKLGSLSFTSAASTTATFTTAMGTCDNRFPVASQSQATVTTFPNGYGGTGWTAATPTEASATVDPRLLFVSLLQANDNVFGTPPLSKLSPGNPPQRLTSDLGFVSCRVTNENAVGQNGINLNHTLQDVGALTTAVAWTDTTGTQGTQPGWAATLQPWSAALPGGTWNHRATITSPAGAVGLEVGNTMPLVLLAKNPNYQPIMELTRSGSPSIGDHTHPGDVLIVNLSILNIATGKKVAIDTGSAVVSIIRYNLATGFVEYLNNDGTTFTQWTTNILPGFAMVASVNDPLLYQATFSGSATWLASSVIRAQGQCLVGGTPYGTDTHKELVSATANHHDKYQFDGGGFVGFPSK